ncbi:hypothetical protein [Mobilicoccus caccae]|uniref:hypothetical protein n=1 Tax=Mobilicoccus caccae TaxID=1859295 RepID=UPI0024E186E4|nr:hypothetical protein [Mobilicoccus caccae]
MSGRPVLWLRDETRRGEGRSAISPRSAAALIDAGFRIVVEDCPQRAFALEEYVRAGCEPAPTGSWVDAPADAIVVGLKELPEGTPRCATTSTSVTPSRVSTVPAHCCRASSRAEARCSTSSTSSTPTADGWRRSATGPGTSARRWRSSNTVACSNPTCSVGPRPTSTPCCAKGRTARWSGPWWSGRSGAADGARATRSSPPASSPPAGTSPRPATSTRPPCSVTTSSSTASW